MVAFSAHYSVWDPTRRVEATKATHRIRAVIARHHSDGEGLCILACPRYRRRLATSSAGTLVKFLNSLCCFGGGGICILESKGTLSTITESARAPALQRSPPNDSLMEAACVHFGFQTPSVACQ